MSNENPKNNLSVRTDKPHYQLVLERALGRHSLISRPTIEYLEKELNEIDSLLRIIPDLTYTTTSQINTRAWEPGEICGWWTGQCPACGHGRIEILIWVGMYLCTHCSLSYMGPLTLEPLRNLKGVGMDEL